ncbi:MAG: hypothetical protein ACJAS4_001469 [Bacteriovoracaceae bacterium]|jgi:hypothetical protein
MKKLFIGLTLMTTMSATSFAGDKLSVESYRPVYGENCTIYVDMDTNFSRESGLSTFGGAGSVEELNSLETIKELIESRGYTIIENKEIAEFSLETSNGVQCVILEDNASELTYTMSNLLATDFYLSGKFKGDGVENTFNKTIGGLFQKTRFKSQIKKILNYCQKKY